jgi:6-phosphogluconolactonase/glucosamine-6-phosphate isomerase/deaminase
MESFIRASTIERLRVEIYADHPAMGRAAALAVRNRLRRLQAEKEDIRMIFAAAPSQNEFLDALLRQKPMDVVCLGIGENGHLAFNDRPVADFADPALVKAVELDEVCRQQQVNDGCFDEISAVPHRALTFLHQCYEFD